MTFKPSHRVCRYSAQILALLIVLGPLGGAAWSQKTSPQKSSQSLQSLPGTIPDATNLDWYIAARYSIFGPAALSSVDSKSLVFPAKYGIPGVTVNLANKKVSVMNEAGAFVPFSTLQSGGRVIVCDRSDSVVIFTVRPAEEGNAKR